MSPAANRWWLIGAIFMALFGLLNVLNLLLIDGSAARDVPAVLVGAAGAVAAFARYRGWKGLRR